VIVRIDPFVSTSIIVAVDQAFPKVFAYSVVTPR